MRLTPRRRFEVLKRDGFRCTYCGASDRLEVDHVIPRSAGGTDDDGNLTASCWECNRGKAHNEIPGITLGSGPGPDRELVAAGTPAVSVVYEFGENVRSTSSINMWVLWRAAGAIAARMAFPPGLGDAAAEDSRRFEVYRRRIILAVYRAEKEIDGRRAWDGGGNAKFDAMLRAMESVEHE